MTGQLLGVSVVEIRTDQRPLDTGLAQAEGKVDKAGLNMQRALDKRLVSMGQSMQRAGSSLTWGLTVPLAAVGIAAGKMSSDFDAAMERVHTQAGATQKEVDRLRVKVLNLAKDSAFGPTELANALYRLEGAGLRGERAMKALASSAKLAAVGNANVEDTAKAVAEVFASGIKGGGKFNDVVAQLNATVGAGDLKLQGLVDALGVNLLPAASSAGLKLQDVTAALSVFGDQTNNVSGFASQLATALHYLTNPSSKAEKALGDIGLNAKQLITDLQSPQGLLVALTDLRNGVDKLPGGIHGPKAVQALGDILPGGRGRIILDLLNNLDRLDSKYKQIAKTAGQFNSDVAKTQHTTAYEAKQLWSETQASLVKIGHDVLPELLKVGGDIAHDAVSVANAYTSLPKGAQNALIKGGLIAAGIGPALKIAGVFTSGAGHLLQAAHVLGRITGFGSGVPGALGAGGKLTSSVAEMTVANMVVEHMTGGGGEHAPGGNGGSSAAKGAGAGAAGTAAAKAGGGMSEAELAAQAARRTTTIAGGAIVGISALTAMSHAQSGPLNQLNAVAHSLDPTSVLHLVGLPAVSDLLPAVKKRMNLSPAQLAAAGEGFPASQIAVVGRIAAGLPTPNVRGPVGAGAIGGPHTSVAQATKDYALMNAELAKLEGHQQDVKTTANALADLASKAGKVGDVRWKLADSLGSELLKTHSVSSKGVQDILGQFAKLPPNIQGDTASAMLSMTKSMETSGEVAKGTTRKLQQAITAQYERMAANVGDSADKIAYNIQHGSHRAAVIGGQNLANFQASVFNAMNGGVLSTAQGATLIGKALNATLKAFGQKTIPMPGLSSLAILPALAGAGAASSGNAVGSAGAGAVKGISGGTKGAAAGALFQVGRMGERGVDNVPLALGGTDIVVGRGEQVAVFNGDQQADLNRELAHRGGLRGFFARRSWRPHHMSLGGTVQRFASGGFFPDPGTNYSYGEEPLIASRLNALGKALGLHLEGLSGYRSPAHSVAVGGFADDPHTRGLASDTPGVEGVPESTLERFGLTRPFGGAAEADHIQLLAGAAMSLAKAGMPGAAAQIWKNLVSPHVKGDSTVSRIVQAGLQKMTGAANTYGRGHSGSGGMAGMAGIPSGTWKQVATAIAQRHGWGPSEVQSWWGIEQIEDGGLGLFTKNPTSTAIGLAQFIGGLPEYYQWHGNPNTIVGQLTAMANYIAATYHTPSAALAAERSRSPMWYGDGGIVPAFAGGGMPTLDGLNHVYPGHMSGGGAALRPDVVAALAEHVGLPGWTFDQIAYSQSRREPGAIEPPEASGAQGWGLNQITRPFNDWVISRFGGNQHMLNPVTNMRASRVMYDNARKVFGDPMQPWTGGYTTRNKHYTGPGLADSRKASHHAKRRGKHGRPPFASSPAVQALAGRLAVNEPFISNGLGKLNSLLGDAGPSGRLEDLITYTGQRDDGWVAAYGESHPDLDTTTGIVTPSDGSAPYVDWTFVNTRLAQLQKILNWQGRVHNELKQAVKMIGPLVKLIRGAIHRRHMEIAKAKGAIRSNLGEIHSLHGQIRGENRKKHPDHKQIRGWNAQIKTLEQTNVQLGGSGTSIGRGGQIGELGKDIGTLQNRLTAVTGDKSTLLGPSGIGGELGDAAFALSPAGDIPSQIFSLSPGSLNRALSQATGSGAGAGDTTALQQQLALETQIATTAEQQLAVSQAQYRVLSGLPPFGGSFATGGVVPGPVGAARTVIAHGGERITPGGDGDSGPTVHHVIVEDGAVDPNKIRVIAADETGRVTRRMSRTAGRRLPSRGGGRLG